MRPNSRSYLGERGLIAHLSISDEQDYAVAFVVLETAMNAKLPTAR